MTSKEASCKGMVAELIERMPEDLVREVQHYAEYLYTRSQHEGGRRSLWHTWLCGMRPTKSNTRQTISNDEGGRNCFAAATAVGPVTRQAAPRVGAIGASRPIRGRLGVWRLITNSSRNPSLG